MFYGFFNFTRILNFLQPKMVIFQNPSCLRDTYVIISSYTDNQEPLLIEDGASTGNESHFLRPMGRQWWVLASLNILFLLSGQTAGVILGKYYYDEGGSSTWMATLIQTAAFPILLIPYFIILPSSQNTTSTPPSIAIISFVYFALGILFAGDNMLYSVGDRVVPCQK